MSDNNFCFALEIGNATGMPERSWSTVQDWNLQNSKILTESVMGTIKIRPAMFSNINTRNGLVDASQTV
jgi:hypothetical protein